MEETTAGESAGMTELTIERMVPGGWGIAHGGGNTYLVRGGIPGERVAVEVTGERGRALQAEVREVLEAAPDRIVPPCPVANICGGCDLQHMTYEAQLRVKREIVVDAFHRIGRIALGEEFDIIPSPKPFAYRLRASWHLDAMTGDFGYLAFESRQVVDVEHCPILEPLLDDTLRKTREGIRAGLTAAIEYEAAAGDETAHAFDGMGEPLPLYRTVGAFKYRFDAVTFFQANGPLLEPMVEEALWLARQLNETARSGSALDLFSGVGLFSLPLSELFGTVLAVESDPAAVKHAKRNARSNQRANVTVNGLETKRFFKDQRKAAARASFVLVDPPRAGLDIETRTGIIEAAIPAFTYVSCDPTTLARDLKVFLAEGYAIERVRGIDLFPQTHHIEVIAHLRRVR
jgi:23S rRNA (uracil1939-C5)-methyltransferase